MKNRTRKLIDGKNLIDGRKQLIVIVLMTKVMVMGLKTPLDKDRKLKTDGKQWGK